RWTVGRRLRTPRRGGVRDEFGGGRRVGDAARRRVGIVRLPVPGVLRARTAAAATGPGPTRATVAAATEIGAVARRGATLPGFPDDPRGGPRVPAGRLRRPRVGAPPGPHRVAVGTDRRRGDGLGVPVRAVAALRLRGRVRLRGRLTARGEAGGGAEHRPHPPGPAPRPGGTAGAARPRGAGPGRMPSPASRGRPRRARRRRRGGPP